MHRATDRAFRAIVDRLERRYLLTASPLDPSFGDNGIVSIPGFVIHYNNGAPPTLTPPPGFTAVAVLPNGDTLVTYDVPPNSGLTYALPGQLPDHTTATIAEYDTAGNLVTTAGFAEPDSDPDLNPVFNSITLLADGNVMVTGADNGLVAAFGFSERYVAQQYTPDLAPIGNIVRGSVGETVITVQPDGKMVLASAADHGLIRVNSDGTNDPTFNGGNPVAVDFAPQAGITQPDGKILISSGGTTVGGQAAIEILRLNSDGTPDATFAGDGIERASFNFSSTPAVGSINVEPDGSILLAAFADAQTLIASFTPDGQFDRSFANGGLIDGQAGMLVGGGRVITFSGSNISRFLLNGQPDTGFNNGDPLSIPIDARTAAQTPDGRIVVAGTGKIARVLQTPPAPSTGTTDALFSGTVFVASYGNGTTPDPGQMIYIDANHDGRFDAGDPSTISDIDGNYSFSLVPGTYSVAPVLVFGQKALKPAAGSYTVTLVAGALVTYGNFTIVGAGTINSRVYHDDNHDGKPQADEPTVQTLATVYLDVNRNDRLDVGDLVMRPDANGIDTAENLAPGTYQIRAIAAAGYRLTGHAKYTIHIGPSIPASQFDFGVIEIGVRLSGVVFDDRNNNGNHNHGDGPLAGWRIIANAQGGAASNPFPTVYATTDADGHYSMTLSRGIAYSVGIVPAGDGLNTPLFAHSIDATKKRRLNFAEDVGSISGLLYQDSNGNGHFDTGEPTLAGWSVGYGLTAGSSQGFAYTKTDSSGSFTFDDLPPGDYVVDIPPVQSATPQFTISSPSAGQYALTLIPGLQVVGEDFAIDLG